jgi:hypothetical protein
MDRLLRSQPIPVAQSDTFGWSRTGVCIRLPIPRHRGEGTSFLTLPHERKPAVTAIYICVIGKRKGESERALSLSEDVGHRISESVGVLVTGGGPGVMVAASTGIFHRASVPIG